MYCGFCMKWYNEKHDTLACWNAKHAKVMRSVAAQVEIEQLEYYYNRPESEVNR